MKHHMHFAIHTAIMIEKQSFDFYRYAAEMVSDDRTRRLFKRLATEEAEHMRTFHALYQELEFGQLHKLMNLPPDVSTPAFRALLKSVDTNTQEKEALEIALRQEEGCVELYSELARSFKEPDVCKLFEQAVLETRLHYKIIMAEYMRVIRANSRPEEKNCAPAQTNSRTITLGREEYSVAKRLTGKHQFLLAATENIHDQSDRTGMRTIGRNMK